MTVYTVVQTQLACDLRDAASGQCLVTAVGPDGHKVIYRTPQRPQLGDRVRVSIEPLT